MTPHQPAPPVLRRMRWWDVEEVVAVERDVFAPDPWSAEQFWAELAGVPAVRHYVVAEAPPAGPGPARELLGYAGLAVAAGGQADVHTLAVRPDAQRRGLGAVLLDALLAEARRRDCPAVLLEVRADNEAAQRLYAQAGFDPVGVRRGYYEHGRVDALVLRRRLSPSRP